MKKLVKTPQEKKELSLKLDRRNTYGENAKASRKLIPKGKQSGRMRTRRAADAVLRSVEVVSPSDVDTLDSIDAAVQSMEIGQRRQEYKKRADVPLEKVLKRKTFGRGKNSPLPDEIQYSSKQFYMSRQQLLNEGNTVTKMVKQALSTE